MFEPACGFLSGDRVQCGPERREQRLNRPLRLASKQGLELGEHQLNRVEIWTVGWEKHQLTALVLDERPNRRSMMRRQIVHHHDLSWQQGWAQHLAHVPLEDRAIDGAFDDQRGHRPRQPQRTDQGVILTPVARHSAGGALTTRRASIAARHGNMEAALIEEDQLFRGLEQGGEIGLELRAQFLILLGRDPRFFYT